MKVLILYGEPADGGKRADEQDTITQVRFVDGLLGSVGRQTAELCMGLDLDAAARGLQRERPDLVFNLVESVRGHGELIHLAPGLLELLDIPFTGSPLSAMLLTSDKPLSKRQMTLAGLPTPALWDEGTPAPGCRWIVKSVWEHASLGMDEGSVVAADRVEPTLTGRSARFGGKWFAEAYVDGREFNLSMLDGPSGPEVLPPAEIDFAAFPAGRPRILDYAAKWDEHSFAYRNTPRRFDPEPADGGLIADLKRLALRCWAHFGLRGYARVDFRVDGAGRPWILEVNANPCLSPDAGFMAAAGRAGLSPSEVLDRIIRAAMGRDEAGEDRRLCS